MNNLNRGKLCTLKDLFNDPNTQVGRKAAAQILGEVLTDEDFERGDMDAMDTMDDTDWNEEIRTYGREVIAGGAGLIPAVRLICDRFDLSQKDFAALIGTSPTTVSLAVTGRQDRMTLLCKMTEFFGTDGAAGKDGE